MLARQSQKPKASQLSPKAIISLQNARIGIKGIADKLNINYDTARKLTKIGWVDLGQISITGKLLKGYSSAKVKEFDRHFVLVSTLAKEIGVNPTNLVEKLASIGVHPISGPRIDSTPLNIFTRPSTWRILKSDIETINGYQTRTGRKAKGSMVSSLENHTFLPLKEAANKLGISPNKTAVLVHRGIITKDLSNPTAVMIDKVSLNSLLDKLNSQQYIHAIKAADQLNCSMNWLSEYWCKSGFLEIYDLVYWKLVSQDALSKVIKLKEEFLTGSEASTLLGMHHSHITNLQKQGIIEPQYFGHPEPIRLFKRTDVLALQASNQEMRLSAS